MFVSSATSRTRVVEGALGIEGLVFGIGNRQPFTATTGTDTSTTGIFDLSQTYTVSFCYVGRRGSDGTKRLQVQVDNNTSGAANSIHGTASRIFNQALVDLVPNTVYSVSSQVGHRRQRPAGSRQRRLGDLPAAVELIELFIKLVLQQLVELKQQFELEQLLVDAAHAGHAHLPAGQHRAGLRLAGQWHHRRCRRAPGDC
jgi:hypothetical protein